MGTVTYPNAEVEKYLGEHFIPVQINVVEQPDMMAALGAYWTPTLIIQDPDEREVRRIEGYLDPKRLCEELALARVQSSLQQNQPALARERVHEALQLTQGDPQREPETLYWSAVAEYKESHDANRLKEGWNRLLEQFPESDWAKKAEVIRG